MKTAPPWWFYNALCEFACDASAAHVKKADIAKEKGDVAELLRHTSRAEAYRDIAAGFLAAAKHAES